MTETEFISECFGPTESQFTLFLDGLQTSEAVSFCENLGQVMATAQNEEEFLFLKAFFDINDQEDNVKMGLQRIENVGQNSNITNFQSFDGTSNDFFTTPNQFPWDFDQPNNFSLEPPGFQNCVTYVLL